MAPIEIAFAYAKKQLFGMQFEKFEYQSYQTNLVYRWNGNLLAKLVCLLLVTFRLDWLAFGIFSLTVVVLPVEPKALALMKNLIYKDNGQLIVDYEYDEVNLTITRVVVYNNSGGQYSVKARATATGRQYSLTIPVGTIDQSIPQDTFNRLGLTVRPDGKLDGVEWEIYPLGA